MKENEYILVTNLAKITIALETLRDTLPGFDGVVTEKERGEIIAKLAKWQDEAHKKIKVTE